MKHTTESIIEALRAGAWAAEIKLMDIAADRLRELQRERDESRAEVERLNKQLEQAIAERTPHDYGILADQRDDYRERLGVAAKEAFEAQAKVELLTKERDGYFAEMERMQRGWGAANQEVIRLEDHIEDLKKAALTNLTAAVSLVRPEPSRLEIAAMLKAGWFCNFDNPDALACPRPKWWIEQADALIAAAREAK